MLQFFPSRWREGIRGRVAVGVKPYLFFLPNIPILSFSHCQQGKEQLAASVAPTWAAIAGKLRFRHQATSRRPYGQYETDSVAASAANKIVLCELGRNNTLMKIKFFHYIGIRQSNTPQSAGSSVANHTRSTVKAVPATLSACWRAENLITASCTKPSATAA